MEVGSSNLPGTTSMNDTFVRNEKYGGLAQLARAPALQAGGQRFESVILHFESQPSRLHTIFDILDNTRFFKRTISVKNTSKFIKQ